VHARSISAWSMPRSLGRSHVLVDGHVRVQGVVLEDHGDVAVLGRSVLQRTAPIVSSPPVISSSPATILRSVVLPDPEGPTSTANSPSGISSVAPATQRNRWDRPS